MPHGSLHMCSEIGVHVYIALTMLLSIRYSGQLIGKGIYVYVITHMYLPLVLVELLLIFLSWSPSLSNATIFYRCRTCIHNQYDIRMYVSECK